ncbi:Glycolate dehydrogenase, iron-sulfur subunit GlcF [hydrothermal vent metagenome]|uniref:Glycolate dehydrogenase, iron-sulfur subunit GlcF n=1 Tax=hydrothermal vent metagenome TaxID=652676 RepID=A0A3B0YSQ9_9ZZZZ
MKTELTQTHLNSARGQRADNILRSCVHCGFCNATCPTYQLLGDELDGPRGRIYQIKQLLEGQPATHSMQTHLDRCLTCRACETTCPSGVDYHSLLDIGRELVDEQLPRSLPQKFLRRALVFFLGNTQRAKLLFGTARLFRPLLPSGLKHKIPTVGRIPRIRSDTHTRRMLLLDGCVQPAAAPQINAAARLVFDKLGIELHTAGQVGCCGALQHHLDDAQGGLDKARANINAWWPAIEAGCEAIVITASGCAPMVKDYASLLADDPMYAERAVQVSKLAKDVSEVLSTEDLGAFSPREVQRIAFHSPCTLQHGQQLNGCVETLLTNLGFKLVDVKDAHLCCGSAGTYSILQAKLSNRLREQKLGALQEKQPELIATANIGCLLHLQQGTDIPVVHWLELFVTTQLTRH